MVNQNMNRLQNMNRSQNMTEKQKLRNFINETSFAIDDVVLYLDTHPTDPEALEYYKKYRDLYQQAAYEYTEKYGPITADNVSVDNKWTWTECPWPWEMEG